MINGVYSVFDSAVKAYSTPMFFQTDGLAIRIFQDQVNNSESQIYKHPEQFFLFKLAQFDDAKGEFRSLDTPLCLAKGVELKEDASLTVDQFSKILEKLNAIQSEVEK